MGKVYSDHKLEKFQVLGTTVRAHWNFEEVEETNMFDEVRTVHRCDEAVFNYFSDRESIIEAVLKENGPAEQLSDEWELFKNA